MSLLQFVERHLGQIYWWPRNILKHLFIDPPTYLTTMTLIRFFYGNGVPCEIAVQLFQACNDRADFYLAQHFPYYYATWQNWKDATHIGIYFNMHVYKRIHQWFSKKTTQNCQLPS